MQALQQETIQCPYCGELIDVIIDCSELETSYIEDCQVCCRPITLTPFVDAIGELTVRASHENE